MNTDILWQLLRDAMKIGGTALAVRYGLDSAQVGSALDLVLAAGMASVAAGGAVWGVYVRWRTKSVPEAVGARANVPTVNAATGAVEK